MSETIAASDNPGQMPCPTPDETGASAIRNLIALSLGLLPPYALVILLRFTQGRGFTLVEMMLYPLTAGTAALAAHRVARALRRLVGWPGHGHGGPHDAVNRQAVRIAG